MAKPAQAQIGMEKAELRTHVKFARRAPVRIAFADESGEDASKGADQTQVADAPADGDEPDTADAASADGHDTTWSSDGSSTQSASADQSTDDGQAQSAPGPQAVQRYRKSRAVWQATRAKIDADIKKLSDTILSLDHGGALGDGLEQDFLKTIDPILSTLDTSLADLLSTAEKAGSQDEASQALDQARTTIGLYQTFVNSSDTIKELDKNPFIPMAVAKTLNASLQVLSAAMK